MLITDVKDLLITKYETIETAIKKIDAARGKICLVVDDEGKLIATISDGDIRRGFLRGLELGSGIEHVFHENPVSASKDADESLITHLLSTTTIRHIPLVDGDGKPTGLVSLSSLKHTRYLENRVIIMAGGKGSRLMPLTQDTPKPMLSLHGTPILEHILRRLILHGFRHFHFSVNYLSHVIRDYFGSGERWGVNIEYIHEDRELGTAGALGLLKDLPHEPVLIMNGDVLTEINFGEFVAEHLRNEADISVAVRNYTTQIPYGTLSIKDHRIVQLREKPVIQHPISAGIYMLSPDVIRAVKKEETLDMPELINEAINSGKTVTPFLITEDWIDIGHHDQLKMAEAKIW